jgi:predicted SprT family Zn-dependent metalloprotease
MRPTETTYAELQLAYDTFNRELFAGVLPACLITLQREKATAGYFSSRRFGNRAGQTTDEIALNPAFFATSPLVEIPATLVHEMVHLWQAHFGSPGRGRYHNSAWAEKMESIGLMPSDTGQPGGRKTGDQMADYPIAGGKFLATCAKLITDEFSISWYDRFAGSVAAAPTPHAAAAAELPAAALAIAAHDGVPMVLAHPTAAPQNRSNRSKYTCSCDVNVWGRRSLVIVCGTCNSPFQESGSAPASSERAAGIGGTLVVDPRTSQLQPRSRGH